MHKRGWEHLELARNEAAARSKVPSGGVSVGMLSSLCQVFGAPSEIMNLTHRSYVMHRGRIVGELPRVQLSEERLLHMMFGESPEALGPERDESTGGNDGYRY